MSWMKNHVSRIKSRFNNEGQRQVNFKTYLQKKSKMKLRWR